MRSRGMIVSQEVDNHLLALKIIFRSQSVRGEQQAVQIRPGRKKTRREESIMANNNGSSNNLVVPQANQALDQLKYEIASEFGVNLGPDTTSRQNGSVGGEITKRLVSFAEQQMAGR